MATLAHDLGVSESGLGNRVAKAGVDEGRKDRVTSSERAELVELRRKLRVSEMENEILRRAAAYFARENILPNDLHLHRPALLGSAGGHRVLSGHGGVHLGVLCLAGQPGL